MELKDYIKGVITQLGDAINEANKDLKDKGGAYVVATNLSDTNESIIKTKDVDGKDRIVALIDFEIPIEVEGNQYQPRLCIAQISSSNSQLTDAYPATLSKIKFQLPLAMPKVDK